MYDDERNVRLEAEVRDERFEPINDASVELRMAPETRAGVRAAHAAFRSG